MFEAGARGAGFKTSYGDNIVRIGDCSPNLSRLIKRAGVIVAEISMPNPIVYYGIGLADSLGKPILLFKQGDETRKAEFGGTQYYEYEITDLASGCAMLSDALTAWAADKDRLPFGSKALVDRG